MKKKYSLIFLTASLALFADINTAWSQFLGQTGRPVTTAVPFLNITPDARSGAMGEAGVAISPDANATYWNPAKLAFVTNKIGASASYNPWLRNLVSDMSLSYLTGHYKINKRQTVGLALTYFNLGDIQFTDDQGGIIKNFTPREFALNPTFAQQLGEHFSVAVGLRYIYSNLSGNFSFSSGEQTKPGNTVSGDLAVYYAKDMNWGGKDINLALGANLSNLGPKISYINSNSREFIPTNLRFGTAITYNIDPYNKFTFALDFNKLMAPTPPKYDTIEGGRIARGPNGKPQISPGNGKDPSRSALSGTLGSFTDAPDGFKEELQEFTISPGLEYWYNNLFAARAGYFYENKNKGGRQYFTLGAGIRYSKLGLDFAYLIPKQQQNQSPLAETLRFTLHFNFGEVEDNSVTPDSNPN